MLKNIVFVIGCAALMTGCAQTQDNSHTWTSRVEGWETVLHVTPDLNYSIMITNIATHDQVIVDDFAEDSYHLSWESPLWVQAYDEDGAYINWSSSRIRTEENWWTNRLLFSNGQPGDKYRPFRTIAPGKQLKISGDLFQHFNHYPMGEEEFPQWIKGKQIRLSISLDIGNPPIFINVLRTEKFEPGKVRDRKRETGKGDITGRK